MTYRILTYADIDREEWSRLVEKSATGTWFQTPEAYSFYASMPELFLPFVVAIANKPSLHKQTLRAICVGYVTKERNPMMQFFTRRAIIIGGPAIADYCSMEEVDMLMQAVKKEVIGSPIYIETRNFNDYSRWKDAFAKAGFEYRPHLNFHVNCTDAEAMWERLSENRKRQIKKGESTQTLPEGKALLDVTEEDIKEWYAILAELYRTKVKTPLWPVEFFLEAYRQGVGKFMFVRHDGKVVGGSMVVEWKPKERLIGTIYEWFECGLNAEYKEQYPSVMATWAGIQYAHDHGCARYDMMGAGVPEVPYGVRDFKSEFGGEMVEHGRFLYVAKPWLYAIGRMGVRMRKRV